jgi:hypothetical protein
VPSTIPRLIVTTPRSKSTSDHRSARSSLRRAPVIADNRTNMPSSGSLASIAACSRPSCSGDGGVISGCGTRGGEAEAAGLTPIQPHRTPCASARRRIPWMRRIVPGASGRPLRPPSTSSER